MLANLGVPGFKSPIRRIAIALTFIKGPQVDSWVEGILEGLDQLDPIRDNVEYTYCYRLTATPLVGDSLSPLRRSGSCIERRGEAEVTQTSPKVRGNVLRLAQKTLLSVEVTNMGTIYTTVEVTSTNVENRRKSLGNNTDIPNNKESWVGDVRASRSTQ